MRVEALGRRRVAQRLVTGPVHELRDDPGFGREKEVECVEGGIFRISLQGENAVLETLRLDPFQELLRRRERLVRGRLPEPARGRLVREAARLTEVADTKIPLDRARRGHDLAKDRLEPGQRKLAALLARQPLKELPLSRRVKGG